MYELSLPKNLRNNLEELVKVFLMPDEYKILETDEDFTVNKSDLKREIFNELSSIKGYRPEWGILTGVKPVKVARELYEKLGSISKVRETLEKDYYVSKNKIDILLDTFEYQQKVIGKTDKKSIGIYIGIPFCPTRCLYCSFTSNQKPESEIKRYLVSLKKEIEYVGKRMKETGLYPESIYIGGGTPTTLSAILLDDLLNTIFSCFDTSKLKEFTVEAGRPDTITKEKLEVIKKHGIKRISINPQSMKEETLELIGRSHKPIDIVNAFELAKEVGIEIINCDLITGLPEENESDFNLTLDKIFKLNPKNITVHTLAVKRASRLIDEDPTYNYKEAKTVEKMLEIADFRLKSEGYRPYYMYRLKNMAGSYENVGWCKEDTPCIYNIQIMDERQSILALGAGAISKIYFENENRLERIPNVSNYEVYIERLDQMLDRKEQQFFKEVENAY